MERKEYRKPFMFVEHFLPQEYCVICTEPNEWAAQCQNHQSLIFWGGEESGPYDYSSDGSHGGCGLTHLFTLDEGEIPTANCWILKNVNQSNASSSRYRNWFSQTGRNGIGWVIREDMIQQLKDDGELVIAYASDKVLDNHWLVTSDLAEIHPAS